MEMMKMKPHMMSMFVIALMLLFFQIGIVFGVSELNITASEQDQATETTESLPPNDYSDEILGIALPKADGNNGWYRYPFYVSAYVTKQYVKEMKYVAIRKDEGPWVFGNLLIDEDGIIKLTAFAENIRGGKLIAITTVKVDFTPPEASIISTAKQGDNGWYLSPVNVEVQGWDSLSGLDNMVMTINHQTVGLVANSGVDFEEKLLTLQSTLVQDGIHLISARLTDRAGNSGEFESIIKMDFSQPQLTINRPSSYFGDIRLQGSFQDGPSGVREIFVNLGEGWLSAKMSGNQWRHIWKTSQKVTDGKYNIQVKAVDQAGNESISVKQIEVLNHQWPFVGLIGVAWVFGLTALFDPRIKAWKGICNDIRLILWQITEGRHND